MSGPDDRALALGLAGAASLLELGPIVALLHQGHGIAAVLAAGLAYQAGNAAPRPRALGHPLLLGAIALTGGLVFYLSVAATAAWFASIAALSWTLQATRRRLTAAPATSHKRIARVAGFIAAALAPIAIWLTLALATIAIALGYITQHEPQNTARKIAFTRLEWTMFVHQTHYFSYAYAIPVLVARPELGGFGAIGFWFACGWISYLSAEALWRRFSPRPVFIIGHVSLAAILVSLTLTSAAPVWVVTFWILSGFGGGTVYCLTLLHRQSGGAPERLERAEDAGHLVGVALALALVLALDVTAAHLPALGAAWALGAALLLLTIPSTVPRSSAHAD